MASKVIEALVTVIVPVYNTEQFVARAIESIIKQTYRNVEIILIDDGSTDKSGIICDQHAVQDMRIKVVHTQNRGVGAARNTGIDMSMGRYIMFLDSDDEMPLDIISRFTDCMALHPCGAILGGFKLCGRYDISYTAEEGQYKKNDFLYHGYLDDVLKFYLSTVTATLFCSRIIKENNLRFSERLVMGEDGIFMLKYLESVQNVYIIKDISYYYHCFTPEERVHSVGCVYTDEYEFCISYFGQLVEQLGVLENEARKLLLKRFFDILMPALVRMAAYGTFYNRKELKSRMKDIVSNNWVNEAAKTYRRKYREHSRIIPYCIKNRYAGFALILLKMRTKKYLKGRNRNIQVRSVYRK